MANLCRWMTSATLPFGCTVSIGDDARERMLAGRRVVDRALAQGTRIYGLTTAYGALKRVGVPLDRQASFNRATVLAHIVGQGPVVPVAVVRAAMLVRAQGFALGRSGVRPAVADAYVAALNACVHPPVRLVGSLGQSDLAPLAEIARSLIGEGADRDAWGAANLEAIEPEAKEALAMMSANAFSVGGAASP